MTNQIYRSEIQMLKADYERTPQTAIIETAGLENHIGLMSKEVRHSG